MSDVKSKAENELEIINLITDNSSLSLFNVKKAKLREKKKSSFLKYLFAP